jgi:hypothetical protein
LDSETTRSKKKTSPKLAFLRLLTRGGGGGGGGDKEPTSSESSGSEAIDLGPGLAAAREKLGELDITLLAWEQGGFGEGWKALRLRHGQFAKALEQVADAKDRVAAQKALLQVTRGISEAAGSAADTLDRWKRWDRSSKQLEPLVTAALKRGAGEVQKIRSTWALAGEKAEAGDPVEALSLLSPLILLIREADKAEKTQVQEETAGMVDMDQTKVQLLTAKWNSLWGKMAPLVQSTLEKGIAERTRLEATWAFAHEKAELGQQTGSVADLTLALQTLVEVKKIIDNAVVDETVPKGTVVKAKQLLEGESEGKRVHALLLSTRSTATKVSTRLTKAFEPKTPEAIEKQIEKIDKLLYTGSEADLEKLEKAATDAAEEIVKLEELARQPLIDKGRWEKDVALFKARLVSLTNHKAANGKMVKPLVKGVTDGLDAAELKATALTWALASQDLPALYLRCDEVEKQADSIAELIAVQADRKERLASLPDVGTIAHDVPKEAVKAALKLMKDGGVEAQAGRYDAAKVLYNKIPEAVALAQDLVGLAAMYAVDYPVAVQDVINIAAWDQAVKDEIVAEQASHKKLVEDADFDKTKSFALSTRKLRDANGFVSLLVGRRKQITAWLSRLKEFDLRLKAVKEHKGRIAIEEHFARLTSDRVFALKKVTEKDFYAAEKVLAASEGEQTAKLALADIGEDYIGKKKKLDEDIDKVLKAKNGSLAATFITDARAHISAGEAMKTAGQWPEAVKCLEQAAARVTLAEKVLGEDKGLKDLKDDGKLDNIATDFPAAYDVYEKMLSHVQGKDDGTFATPLKAATAAGKRAEEAAKKETPDYGAARIALDQAMKVCEDVLVLITRKPAYDSNRSAVVTAHGTTLPPLNDENCIDQLIQDIGAALDLAAELAKSPVFNYAEAEGKLSEAQNLVAKAKVNAEAWKTAKPDVKTIQETHKYISTPIRKKGMGAEVARLEKIGEKMEELVKKGDMPALVKEAAIGVALCAPFRLAADAYVKAMADVKTFITDRRASIEGNPISDPELTELKAVDKQIEEAFKAHAFAVAAALAASGFWVIDAGEQAIAEHKLYEVERVKAEDKVKEVELISNLGVLDQVQALRSRYKAVLDMAGARNFPRAKKMAESIPGDADLIPPLATAYKECKAARDTAGKALEKAEGHKNALAIAPLVTKLKARFEVANKLELGGDRVAAKKIFEELATECADALLVAGDHDQTLDLARTAKENGSPSNEQVVEAREKAELIRNKHLEEPEALYVIGPMTRAHTLLKESDELHKGGKSAEALQKIGAALEELAAARIGMGHYKQMEAEAKSVRKAIDDLLGSHAQADFIRPDCERLQEGVDKAIQKARTDGAHEVASKSLADIDQSVHRLKGVATAHVAYLKERDELSPGVALLEKHAHRYAAATELKDLRKHLATASQKADAHDHKDAMVLLSGAGRAYEAAQLKVKMAGNEAPGVDDVQAILKRPGGEKHLDKIVAGLEPSAQRKVLRAAMEARFGCKLNVFPNKVMEDEYREWIQDNPDASEIEKKNKLAACTESDGNLKGPNLRRFYDVMSDLPDTHTKENDSMQVFSEVSGPAKGSAYNTGRKEVMMREGAFQKSGDYLIAQEHEIEAPDPECTPVPGRDLSYFDWNTLHEVGHAVDDKHNFMKRNGKTLAGWEDYGNNVLPIATAIAKKHKYDAGYITAYMGGEAKPAIPEPVDCDADEWERRRVICRLWVDNARFGKDPWSSAASAKALEIEGVVYHESYENSWSSYPLAERAKGVSGYQFRAPGEWFAELYAAYHSGKMNPSHPARSWLADL